MQNNNRVKDYIHLLWIGSAIVVCVAVAAFLDKMTEAGNVREHELLRMHADRCFEENKNTINAIRDDMKEVKTDVKELLKKSR